MIITIFRSRLRPGIGDDYLALSNRMFELAQTMPGFIAIKDFAAEDGERVAVVEFAHEDGQRAWRSHPEHIEAQKLARQKYYSEYHIQVCTLEHESKFNAADDAAKARA
jgi:heme-degrading monooxygenase HmoA